jgi:2-phospho-L-lactate guanylyltransferase (CobY/MobA/RfbA family)
MDNQVCVVNFAPKNEGGCCPPVGNNPLKTAAAAGLTIAVANGGNIVITPADLALMYPAAAPGAVTTAKKLMAADGTSLTIKQAVSSLGTLLNYWVIVP